MFSSSTRHVRHVRPGRIADFASHCTGSGLRESRSGKKKFVAVSVISSLCVCLSICARVLLRCIEMQGLCQKQQLIFPIKENMKSRKFAY